ncbi:hypothetical protein GQ53DRAFT_9029 [Thozetella sp. PMI_491]|nr:hypothetical protein GQ53DRAFT_9029 [Thozetella sp. PMI_491]
MSQFRLLLQSIVTLLQDLQLDQSTAPSTRGSQEILETSELKRALLGCYYLCTAYALPGRRPNLLQYSQYMEQCCSQLLANPSSAADSLSAYMIRLRRIMDAADNATDPSEISVLELQLQNLVDTICSWNQQHAEIFQMHQFYIETKLANCSMLLSRDLQELSQTLMSCVRAASLMLAHLSTVDPNNFKDYAMIQWSQLDHTTLFVFQLISFALANPPAMEDARELVNLGTYFDGLYLRMTELSRSSASASSRPDRFCLLASIMSVIREKFEKMAARLTAAQAGNGTPYNEEQFNGKRFCPVLSGAIRCTEYWEIFMEYDSSSTAETLCVQDETKILA